MRELAALLADAGEDQRRRPLPDSYWVLPGRLAAGEYPGHWREEVGRRQLEDLVAAGLSTFVDLTEAGEYGLMPYDLWLPSGGEHHRFPIPDMGVPEPAEMAAILDAIDAALAAGRGVYVHCFGGVGRTGTVVGCWLVRHGLTPEQALARIAHWRQGTPDGRWPSPQTPQQQAFVRSWREAPSAA